MFQQNIMSALGEKEMLNDILNQEKLMASTYTTAITEASCQNLRKVLTKNMQECCEDQYQVFDRMRTLGFYQTKQADATDVEQAKQKFSQVQQQLE